VRLLHVLRLSPAAALLVDLAADKAADEAVAAVAETVMAAAQQLHPVFALLKYRRDERPRFPVFQQMRRQEAGL
jgi:hypothetical protein